MKSFLYFITPFIAAMIVFVPFFLIKSPTIARNKEQYYRLLMELEKDPQNDELKLMAWQLGRKYYGSARVTGMATPFDESIIQCEIMAVTET